MATKFRLCIIGTLIQLNSTSIFKPLFNLLHPRWSWLPLCTRSGSWVLQKCSSAVSIVVSQFSQIMGTTKEHFQNSLCFRFGKQITERLHSSLLSSYIGLKACWTEQAWAVLLSSAKVWTRNPLPPNKHCVSQLGLP